MVCVSICWSLSTGFQPTETTVEEKLSQGSSISVFWSVCCKKNPRNGSTTLVNRTELSFARLVLVHVAHHCPKPGPWSEENREPFVEKHPFQGTFYLATLRFGDLPQRLNWLLFWPKPPEHTPETISWGQSNFFKNGISVPGRGYAAMRLCGKKICYRLRTKVLQDCAHLGAPAPG